MRSYAMDVAELEAVNVMYDLLRDAGINQGTWYACTECGTVVLEDADHKMGICGSCGHREPEVTET